MVCNAFRPVTNVCIGEDYHGYLVANAERSRFRRRNCDVIRRTCGTMECCRVVVCPTQVIDIPKRMYILPFPLWGSFSILEPKDAPLSFPNCFPLAWDDGNTTPVCTADEGLGSTIVGEFRSSVCDVEVQGGGDGYTYYFTGATPPTLTTDLYSDHVVDDPHVLIEFAHRTWLVSAPGLKPHAMGGANTRVEPFSDAMSVTISNDTGLFYPDVNGTFLLTWDRGAYYYLGTDAVIGVKLSITGHATIAYGGPATHPSAIFGAWGGGSFDTTTNLTDEPYSVEWDDGLGFSATMTEV